MKLPLITVPRVLTALATMLLLGAPASCAPQQRPQANKKASARRAPAKKATPQVLARIKQNNAQLAKLEVRMVQLVNAARAAQGLKPLQIDPDLADVSRAHSLEMRDRDYFAHESPTESLRNPLDRYRAGLGATPRIVAENVYRSWGSPQEIDENDVRNAHNALMKSPGHRANIVMPNLTRIGIGFISNRNGDLWITQMFSRPMD